MSYILDALNRADTERERGAAPSLHSRHSMPDAQPKSASVSVLRAWRVFEAVAVVGVAVLGWWWWQASPQQPIQTIVQSTPVPAPLPAVPAFVQPAAQAVVPASSAVTAAASLPTQAVPVRPVAKAKAALETASAPRVNLPLLSELPESLRSQLPKITINGSVYTEQASQRLLFVNNLVLGEGAELSKELRLERIQPHSSEFSFRGTRFRLTH